MADPAGAEGAVPTPSSRPGLDTGMQVEVRSSLDGSWQTGFVVDEVTSVGYRLRRESDGSVLPEVHADRVRRRRRRSTWWI